MNLNKRRSLSKLRRKKLISVASSNYSGSNERCGDSCLWAMLPDGRFAVALSDGTGKGDLAARESSRAVNSVIALLKAGMDPEMALQILNLLWAVNNRKELFPTMDLAVLDPGSRELKIYKIGAAPTVVLRAPRCRPGRYGANCASVFSDAATEAGRRSGPPEKIEILAAPAVPMGVSEHSEITCVSTLVMPGDRIIMMTDGIADSRRDDPEMQWIRQLVNRIKSRDLQIVSDLIIREAALNYGVREKDDMTVVAVAVSIRGV